jgi:type VI secretion system protein ImpA
MSLQALLEPTNDDPPCGPNLEYDPEFVAVDQALRPRPEQLVGEPAAGSAEPDWADIRRRCEALLGRTRDLRLAMMYVRALTHTDQLAGFAEGLGLVSGLLERYWPSVHPALDPADGNDPTLRLNVLAGLAPPQGAGGEDTLFRDLRSALVVAPDAAGRVAVRDVLVAAGLLPQSETAPGNVRLQNEACFRKAAEADPAALTAPRQALDAATRIRDYLNDTVGADRAPDLKPLCDMLRAVADAVDAAVAPEAPSSSDAALSAAPGLAAAARPATGELRSRADVVQRLEEICLFLERTEPANPAPLLLRRAQRLVTKSFMEIIEDIAPGGLEQVRTIAGVRDEQ